MTHLVSGMAKRGKSPEEIERALQLETVPEAEQGKRTDTVVLTSGNECPKLAPRTAKLLRAITRAPDAVKDAYREGRINASSFASGR